jgi:hypothetical protein
MTFSADTFRFTKDNPSNRAIAVPTLPLYRTARHDGRQHVFALLVINENLSAWSPC